MFSLRKIPVCLFFYFLFSAVSGSDPWRLPAGAAEAGTGYACLTMDSFWASFHNQALLSLNSSFRAGFSYENRFRLPELGTRSAAIMIPAGKATMGALYSYFGNRDFSRQFGGLSCGLRISEKIAAGAQVDYFAERTYGDYGNSTVIAFEAGLLVQAGKSTRVGIHVFNPLPSSLYKTVLPARIRVGTGTSLSSGLFAAAEAEMSTGGRINLKTGLEYEAMKSFMFRGGFSTANNSFSFGIGYSLSFVQLDIGFVTHDRLGVTSSASLVFIIK